MPDDITEAAIPEADDDYQALYTDTAAMARDVRVLADTDGTEPEADRTLEDLTVVARGVRQLHGDVQEARDEAVGSTQLARLALAERVDDEQVHALGAFSGGAWEYEYSTFSGWIEPVDDAGTDAPFNRVSVPYRPWDVSETTVRIYVALGTLDNVVATQDVTVGLEALESEWLEVDLDDVVEPAGAVVFVGFKGHVARAGFYSIGLVVPSSGAEDKLHYTTTGSPIDAPIWMPSASHRNFPVRLSLVTRYDGEFRFTEPAVAQIRDLAGGRDRPMVEGRANLAGWRAGVGRSRLGLGPATLVLVGDSWVNTTFRAVNPLRARLLDVLGEEAGVYLSAFIGHGSYGGYSRGRTGTWADQDLGAARGVDGAHATSSTPGSQYTIAGDMDALVIGYYRQPGGGTLRYRVGEGAWADQSTDGVAGFGSVEVGGLGGAGASVTVEVSTAGTAGVTLTGFEPRRDVPSGYRLYKVGNGGARASQYIDLDAATWQAGLGALASDVGGVDAVALLLGTNDAAAGVSAETFSANLGALVSRIRQAVPTASVVLVPSGPNGHGTAGPLMAGYRDAVRDAAVSMGCGFVDLYAAMGSSYADALALGLTTSADNVHPSPLGGEVIGSAVWDLLRP